MNINCHGSLLNLSSPKIMAIVNLTPDSFYDEGINHGNTLKKYLNDVILDGAEIIDLGAMSSRPGAEIIPHDIEWKRLEDTLLFIKNEYPKVLVSIDTIHSLTAKKALDAGAHIINDISAGKYDENMFSTISAYNPGYIMMHMKGTPKTMTNNTDYKNLLLAIIDYFKTQVALAHNVGISNLIIDPGFGFSKTIDQNYQLLNKLEVLNLLSIPLLVGISRKSMIYKVLGSNPKEALNGTSVLHLKALQQGARILRVHDVKEAKETITLFEKLSVNK